METKLQNVALMQAERGFDIIIVCTSTPYHQSFWQKRLDASKGSVVPTACTVLVVEEDWAPGGAGNLLGTIYAWKKACEMQASNGGKDLWAELDAGKTVAMYHTAGKGTRMEPVTASEKTNKPAIKLPTPGLVSVLEGVIRQTGAYAKSRPGRLSVFWGDQIFVPSVPAEYSPLHHADILCALGPMPSAEEWKAQGLEQYGLIAASAEGSVLAMMEKVTHDVASAQLQKYSNVDKVGWSLGCFSVSQLLLRKLLDGFAEELGQQKGKMDSDPHLWMAVTLEADAYSTVMQNKKLFDDKAARDHHARIQELLGGLTGPLFGAVNVGPDCSWWDYGQLRFFIQNSLLLTLDSEEAVLARNFFGISGDARKSSDSEVGECKTDPASVIISTTCSSGAVSSSAIAGVKTQSLEATGAVLINVQAKSIVAKPGSLGYNIKDDSPDGLVLSENEVVVGVHTDDACEIIRKKL